MEISRVIRRYSYWEILLEYSIVTIVLGCLFVLTTSVNFLRTLQSNRLIILDQWPTKEINPVRMSILKKKNIRQFYVRIVRVADLSLELNYETNSYQQLFHQTLTSSSSEVCDQCFPKSGDIRYQTSHQDSLERTDSKLCCEMTILKCF